MILAIDTSGADCGVALWHDELVGHIIAKGGLRHNEILISLIDDLLNKHSHSGTNLDAVAVSAGPGSFTGLRIGMAVAKGLCFAGSIPLISVPTLDALAASAPPSVKRVLALMPARATEVYWAEFERSNGSWKKLTENLLADITELAKNCPERVYLMGEGYRIHQTALDQYFADRSIRSSDIPDPLVCSIAKIGAIRFEQGVFDDLMESEPQYCYAFPRRKS